ATTSRPTPAAPASTSARTGTSTLPTTCSGWRRSCRASARARAPAWPPTPTRRASANRCRCSPRSAGASPNARGAAHERAHLPFSTRHGADNDMAVTTTLRDGIAVVTFDNLPVNGLGLAVRRGLAEAISAANADGAVRGIAITGGGRFFSGGADIKEFNTPRAEQAPNLHDVIAAVEDSGKPVCVAINGTALGGGLELALGANYRVAAATAEVGLPEVKIGILPGAGGTQRLPRAVGLETALNMIVSGAPVAAAKLAGTALFDAVVEGDPVEAAVALLEEKIAAGGSRPRVRDLEVEHDDAQAFLAWARMGVAAASKNYPAPVRCVDAVAASLKPFEQGMAIEREGFTVLVNSPESRALRHAFFGERAAARIDDVGRDVQTRPVERVGVVGAGTMGGGISMNFLNAGIPVA